MHSSRSTEAAASIGQHVEFAIRLAGEGGAEEGKSRFAAGGGCPREFLTWKPGHLLGKGNESGKAEREMSGSGSAEVWDHGLRQRQRL